MVGDADADEEGETLPVGAVDGGAEVQATETSSSAANRDAERGGRLNMWSRYRGSPSNVVLLAQGTHDWAMTA